MGQIAFNKRTLFPVKNVRKLFPQEVGRKERTYGCATVRKHSHAFGVGSLLAQKKPRQEMKVKGTRVSGTPRQHAPLNLSTRAFKEHNLGNSLGGGIKKMRTRWKGGMGLQAGSLIPRKNTIVGRGDKIFTSTSLLWLGKASREREEGFGLGRKGPE